MTCIAGNLRGASRGGGLQLGCLVLRLLCRVQCDLSTHVFAPWRRVDRRFLSILGCSRTPPPLSHMEAITLSGAQEGVQGGVWVGIQWHA